jgi:hypothetical protein
MQDKVTLITKLSAHVTSRFPLSGSSSSEIIEPESPSAMSANQKICSMIPQVNSFFKGWSLAPLMSKPQNTPENIISM